jgi:hypothetical protein
MHLICFILLFVATGPSGRGDLMILNMKLTKTFFSFLSIPYYIYVICQVQHEMVKSIIQYEEESNSEVYTLKDEIYISKKNGNTYIWLEIEVFAFYVNLFVCVLYLVYVRCVDNKNHHDDIFADMIVLQYTDNDKPDQPDEITVYDTSVTT